jgi:beta-1,4-N-acetylglucosaminyltransferase
MSVLVTVGTTKFDSLIQAVDDPAVQSLLKSLGYNEIICQIGTGSYIPSLSNFRLVPSLLPFIQDADLIISHGGAGTILESLRMGKKLIVVTNTYLMNNHQSELSSELSKNNQILLCPSPSDLLSFLSNLLSFRPSPLPPSNRIEFWKTIHKLLV